MAKIVEGEQRRFITGNEVVVWGALAAGGDLMYGYPITPQNEIMHYWTRLAPRFGKGFLQTEDELSAGFATLGGVMAGKKAFSGTSGPGNVLMQEPISMAEMMRIPAVWIIQQGRTSTATVIYSQQETRLTCFGGNGEGLRIVYSTASHQDLFDYTIKALNTAWRYRFPTLVLGDGYQAKMQEAVTLYNPEERGIEIVPSEPLVLQPGTPARDRPPPTTAIPSTLKKSCWQSWRSRLRSTKAWPPNSRMGRGRCRGQPAYPGGPRRRLPGRPGGPGRPGPAGFSRGIFPAHHPATLSRRRPAPGRPKEQGPVGHGICPRTAGQPGQGGPVRPETPHLHPAAARCGHNHGRSPGKGPGLADWKGGRLNAGQKGTRKNRIVGGKYASLLAPGNQTP